MCPYPVRFEAETWKCGISFCPKCGLHSFEPKTRGVHDYKTGNAL